MTRGTYWRFWAAGIVLFVGAAWLLSGMLFPFVAGLVLAYMLDPLVDRVAGRGVPRSVATILVLTLSTTVLLAVLLLLAPLIYGQLQKLIGVLPEYIRSIEAFFEPKVREFLTHLSAKDVESLRGAAGRVTGDIATWLVSVLQNLLASGLALFDVLSVVFITPVVAFYLLRDWDRMVAAIDGWLPRPQAATIRAQMRDIDSTLAAFVRGQATVCLSLGLFYAGALTLAGLDFGLIVGLLSGFLSFIPYVGTIFGFIASVGVAFGQSGDLLWVGLVAGIFVIGQAIEGNVLTPLLVGDRVGLHPVWVIFALLAGAFLFGFVGLLVAVPVTAAIGVLTRFALRRYLASPFYQGGIEP
jgi:predicted PurR-regulated permease PerM